MTLRFLRFLFAEVTAGEEAGEWRDASSSSSIDIEAESSTVSKPTCCGIPRIPRRRASYPAKNYSKEAASAMQILACRFHCAAADCELTLALRVPGFDFACGAHAEMLAGVAARC